MAEEQQQYRRLGGAWRMLLLAPDHLLLISNGIISQSYKRFYFADIQALLLQRTRWGAVKNVLLGFLTLDMLVFVIAGLALDWHPAAMIVTGTIGLIFGAALLVNWIKGPTCACYVQTAVQNERIYSLNRVKMALKVFAVLREAIEAVQGALTDGEASRYAASVAVAEPSRETAAAPARAATRHPRSHTPPAEPARKAYRSHAHEWLFVTLIADVCHSCVRFFVGGMTMLTIGVGLGLALIVTTITALVKQQRTDLSKGVRSMTWASLGYVVFTYLYGMISSTIQSIANPELASDSLAHMRVMANSLPLEHPGEAVFLLIAILCSSTLGFGGLLALNAYRKRAAVPPRAPLRGEEIAPPPPPPSRHA